MLDRTRHEALVKEIRAVGARIRFLDGDVAGAIMAVAPELVWTSWWEPAERRNVCSPRARCGASEGSSSVGGSPETTPRSGRPSRVARTLGES